MGPSTKNTLTYDPYDDYYAPYTFEQVFYPIAHGKGTSTSSRAWARTTPTVNSVVVILGHDEDTVIHQGSSSVGVKNDPPRADVSEDANDEVDATSNDGTDGVSSNGFNLEEDYEASESSEDKIEVGNAADIEVDTIIADEVLDVDNEEEETDLLL